MTQEPAAVVQERGKSCVGKVVALAGALGSVLFLLNLTIGLVEIPDNLPFIGNADEVIVAGVLFSCLSYLGLNVLPFTARRRGQVTEATTAVEGESEE